MRPSARLAVQLAAAAIATSGSGPTIDWVARSLHLPLPLAWAGVLLWIVWLTNLYNFMDGINGLAGGQAMLAAVGLGVACYHPEAPGVAGLLFVLAAATAGFLPFNFPRASIFMGDAAATGIGFFFGCVPLLSVPRPVGFGAVAVALGLFLLDATSTLLRRLARGERVWEPHRSHWYQRPLAAGISHTAITLPAWGGMALCALGAAAWPTADHALRAAIGAGVVGLFLLGVVAVRRLERRQGPRPQPLAP
jgi:UDP-N-acetylmuramyl pentapeptide phosphotransferase/UDP-N-acetylglucosamine-1-phosphate transferase